MKTLVIKIDNKENAAKIKEAVKQFKGVKEVLEKLSPSELVKISIAIFRLINFLNYRLVDIVLTGRFRLFSCTRIKNRPSRELGLH